MFDAASGASATGGSGSASGHAAHAPTQDLMQMCCTFSSDPFVASFALALCQDGAGLGLDVATGGDPVGSGVGGVGGEEARALRGQMRHALSECVMHEQANLLPLRLQVFFSFRVRPRSTRMSIGVRAVVWVYFVMLQTVSPEDAVCRNVVCTEGRCIAGPWHGSGAAARAAAQALCAARARVASRLCFPRRRRDDARAAERAAAHVVAPAQRRKHLCVCAAQHRRPSDDDA
jgi:Anaphase-promoting complex sub unit 1 C-terminal domain